MHPRALTAVRVALAAVAAASLALSLVNLAWTYPRLAAGAPELAVLGPRGMSVLVVATLGCAEAAALALVVLAFAGGRGEWLTAAVLLTAVAVSVLWQTPALWSAPWLLPVELVAGTLLLYSTVRFAQSFPRRLGPGDLPRWPRGAPADAVRSVLRALLRPPVLVATVGGGHVAAALWAPGTMPSVHAATLCLATAYLYCNLRRGSRAERQRVFWIFEAVLVVTLASLAGLILDLVGRQTILPFDAVFWGWMVAGLGQNLAMLFFAVAIFGAGALDARLVVRATAVYGAVAAAALLLFVVLENLLVNSVAARLGLSDGMGAALAGSLATLALSPLRRATERAVSAWAERADPPAPGTPRSPEVALAAGAEGGG